MSLIKNKGKTQNPSLKYLITFYYYTYTFQVNWLYLQCASISQIRVRRLHPGGLKSSTVGEFTVEMGTCHL